MIKLSLPTPVVSTTWLAAHLSQPTLRILDASWYLPASGRQAYSEFLDGHIPGARYFDIDACSDHTSGLPHMLPPPEHFAAYVEALGVSSSAAVVVYDGSGNNLSAPRVWWSFRYFGHDRVAVLDGGMRRWKSEGHGIESGPEPPIQAREPFQAMARTGLLRTQAEVRAVVGDDRVQIVDMRSKGRFRGTDPEPRPGLRGGHVPGSKNLPFDRLVDDEGMVLPRGRLKRLLAETGVALDRPVIATCGSGTTACSLAWNLSRIGKHDVAVYDGSWSEWGASEDAPVASADS